MSAVFLFLVAFPVLAADWPTYRHDNRRSGVTEEALPFPLTQLWERSSPLPPQTAWPGPAKWDAYAGNKGLQSLRNFDPCFYITASSNVVTFASSVDHAAYALDAATGAKRWVAYAEAPVRLPPTHHRGLAIFGADDGAVRAVDLATGKQKWAVMHPEDARVWNNGQLISIRPVRTGVLVEGDRAFFAGSLVPWEMTRLTAVNPVSGREVFTKEHKQMTLQGAMLLAGDQLVAPQGRSEPLKFDSKDGAAKGAIPGSGGVFCLVTEAGEIVTGPRNQKAPEDVLRMVKPDDPKAAKNALLQVSGADRLLVRGSTVFAYQGKQVVALDRAKLGKKGVDARMWKTDCPVPADIILAGKTLFVGLDDQVFAFDAETGKRVWEATVKGRAFGLTVANGRLFVSTSLGHITAFGSQ